ncbi:MAG: ribonuclease D [Saprospiraceae bacterium]|nr:ribonuclease D [Saprospiraceae bacterium]
MIESYHMIETEETLIQFYSENTGIEWMAFDTEFVGERRFIPLLCLIQVATVQGNYIIDPIKIKDLSLFLEMIENEKILKITHAGDNDYRLLFNLYKVLPKNIFDTQLAAGFVSNTYPISFQKLVEKELNIRVKKGYTVTDWETRPIKMNQLVYALNDVIYLKQLYDTLNKRVLELNRTSWLKEELDSMCTESFYNQPNYKEFVQTSFVNDLSQKEKAFLYRLLIWRKSEAEKLNWSKEMVFASKHISTFVKNINEGKEALISNRTLSDKVLNRHWEQFEEMYLAPISDEEKEVLKMVKPYKDITIEQELTIETLNLLTRYKFMESEIAPSLVLTKGVIKKLIAENDFQAEELQSKWRRELLGPLLCNWLENPKNLKVKFNENSCELLA